MNDEDMLDMPGIPTQAVPDYQSMKLVGYLVWFEGPLLTEYADAEGAPWLVYWVDCPVDRSANRWMVVQPDPRIFQDYKKNLATLYTTLLSDTSGFVHFFDERNGLRLRATICAVADVPDAYLPEVTSTYNPDLSWIPG